MKLGIMQPYFFPYLGYFDLIYNTDSWIIFDTAQYIRHGWVNRNRILHPEQGWQYITVPLKKHSRETVIRDIEINADSDWKDRLLRQLHHYKKYAPYYTQTIKFVEDCLSTEETLLSKINTEILKKCCQRLSIPFVYSVFSEMDLSLGPVEGPGDWALRISEAMGAVVYVNPPGGRDLFDPEQFARSGIRLVIREFPAFEYACRHYAFEQNLSIVDVFMWNTPEQIRGYLEGIRLQGL